MVEDLKKALLEEPPLPSDDETLAQHSSKEDSESEEEESESEESEEEEDIEEEEEESDHEEDNGKRKSFRRLIEQAKAHGVDNIDVARTDIMEAQNTYRRRFFTHPFW